MSLLSDSKLQNITPFDFVTKTHVPSLYHDSTNHINMLFTNRTNVKMTCMSVKQTDTVIPWCRLKMHDNIMKMDIKIEGTHADTSHSLFMSYHLI